MADMGGDVGESNVENKCVPVLFLPVGLRGELGSSEVNAEPGADELVTCRRRCLSWCSTTAFTS
jgi:hypothetical protein